jgi:glycosyltransferase involved in cell wall biosynthesis
MNQPRVALCLEQTLGHRTHGQNLEAAVAREAPAVDVIHVDYPESRCVPVPWALRGSMDARRILHSRSRYDAVLFHTQTIALFAKQATRGGKYIVSVDATPVQVDEMGKWYDHKKSSAPVEAVKRRWYQSVLKGADGVVAWSDWAAASLVDDYGVEDERILVAHPGAPSDFFTIKRDHTRDVSRVLFVGGDFERKGGTALLRAFERLRGEAELVLVTNADVPDIAGVAVLRGVQPGTPELRLAFEQADIFCLPTLGDCTSVAIGEAMAAGLPVITTTVGSNRETVKDGVTGMLVEPGNDAQLFNALETLTDNPAKRREMGANARVDAKCRMDASRNASRVLSMLEAVAR